MVNPQDVRNLVPRNLSAILDETFSIYGRNFFKLIIIAAIAQVPIGILAYIADDPNSFVPLTLSILVGIILFIGSFIVGSLMEGSLIHAISEQHFVHPIDVNRSYRFSWQRIGSLIITSLIVGIACILMFITVIGIPFGIYFAIRWSFVFQSVLLENKEPMAALSRSSELVKDNWWRILGYVIITIIISFVIGFVIGLVGFIPGIPSVVGSTLGAILAVPIGTAIVTLLYFDLRLQKEGYNLEKLSQELGLQDTHQHYSL